MNLKITGHLLLCWARDTFGSVALNPKERALRFFEEACELAQAMGITSEECDKIIKRVYDRSYGHIPKESAQVFLTLLQLCALNRLDLEELLAGEINRITALSRDEWVARHNAKLDSGITTARAE